jgi:nucleotide-binding universal stress UspA family protein
MKILFATDGTKHSEAALEIVAQLNLGASGEIKIITVVDMAVPLTVDVYAGYLSSTAEIEKAAREHAFKILEETKAKLLSRFENQNVSITAEALFGSPESRIVETAEQMHAELIVVGSHGYNRWERLLLGSVSDSVVHHAPCSVLVVRTPKTQA